MSVEELEPSSEVAELPNKPLKKQNKNYRGSLFRTVSISAVSRFSALGLNTSKSCCLSFRSMSVEALEPSSEVAELPKKNTEKHVKMIQGNSVN